jgi:hypothetical protein
MTRYWLFNASVFFQAFLLWAVGVPVWLVLPALIAAGIPFRPENTLFPSSLSWWAILAGAGLATFAVARWMVSDLTISPRLIPEQVTIPLVISLLYVQVVATWAGASRKSPGLVPACGLIAAAGLFNQQIDSSDYWLFLSLAIFVVALLGLQFATRPGVDQRQERSRSRVTAMVLASTAVLAWGLSLVWQAGMVRAQTLLPELLARRVAIALIEPYPRAGSLGSITREQSMNPEVVALRVYCDRTPGYLRGRVFDTYSRSSWKLASHRRGKWNRLVNKLRRQPMPETPVSLDDIPAGQRCFVAGPRPAGPLIRMQIYNDPQRGDVFFTPQGAAFIAAPGDLLVQDEYGVVYAGPDPEQPYTVWASRQCTAPPTDLMRKKLLEPLEGLDPEVERLAAEVCKDCDTAGQAIEQVRRSFHNGFEYTTTPFAASGEQDPLSSFLLSRRAAHCEFFASGAVALLRAEGVPARYVTGYVVTEIENDEEEYFLARNRHAHAWAEAWDDEAGKWVIVEATPGFSVPGEDEFLDSALAGSASAFQNDGTQARLYFFWSALVGWLGPLPLRFVAISVVAGFLFLVLFWLNRDRRMLEGSLPVRTHADLMRRRLQRMDRRLRKENFARRRGETLHQFAKRIRSQADGDLRLLQCADWYVEYAISRYGGSTIRTDAL